MTNRTGTFRDKHEKLQARRDAMNHMGPDRRQQGIRQGAFFVIRISSFVISNPPLRNCRNVPTLLT